MMLFPLIRGLYVQPLKRLSSTLSYSFPDISPKEQDYVQQQVDIVLRPKCLKISEYDETKDTNTEDIINENIFPSAKGYSSLYIGVKFIHKFYSTYRIPHHERHRYARNFNSIPSLERSCHALKWSGMKKIQLHVNPHFVLNTPDEILRMERIASLAEVPICDVPELTKRSHLKGRFVSKFVQKTVESLEILGFSGEALAISDIDYARYSPMTFSRLQKLMTSSMMPMIRNQFPGNFSVKGDF
jgi:hypothetical protein